MPQLQSVEIPVPHGFLEGLLRMPDALPADAPPRMAAVMCHPHPLYGGTMHTKAVFRIAQALAARKPRLAIGYIGDAAGRAESVGFGGIDSRDEKGCGWHAAIVSELLATH